jgi:predicted phosphodiesterase
VPALVTRILSDLHFGEHASRVRQPEQLRPLLDGADRIVLNGDTVDTRPSRDPSHTAACHASITRFFQSGVGSATFLTGNHDADISQEHRLELAEGRVLVTHGDILFDDIVPWSRDAAEAGRRIAKERALAPTAGCDLDRLLAIHRKVAHGIPQRHQAERNRLRFALRYLADTIWPPHRSLLVLAAWSSLPDRAAELARVHRPAARFIITGHTHHRGIWQRHCGRVVINTGSYTLPLDPAAVDVTEAHVRVRAIVLRSGEFQLGPLLGEFPLAGRAR